MTALFEREMNIQSLSDLIYKMLVVMGYSKNLNRGSRTAQLMLVIALPSYIL